MDGAWRAAHHAPAEIVDKLNTEINAALADPKLNTRLAEWGATRAFSPTAYNSGGAGMSGTIGDYARFLQMLLNEGELDGVRVLQAETIWQMTQNATGNMPTLRGPGWASRWALGY